MVLVVVFGVEEDAVCDPPWVSGQGAKQLLCVLLWYGPSPTSCSVTGSSPGRLSEGQRHPLGGLL